MSTQNRTLLIVIGIVVLLFILGGITWFFLNKSSNANQNGASATSTDPFVTTTTTQPANIANTDAPATKYADHGKYYDIDLQYPSHTPLAQIAGEQAEANAVQLFRQFSENTAEGFKEDGQLGSLTDADAKIQGLDSSRKYSLSDTFDFYSSPSTISYNFEIYSDTLGAHPNTYYRSFTFDAKTGTSLGLGDLFVSGVNYLNTLSTLSRTSLTSQLGDNGSPETINAGTTPDEDNFQNFVIDGKNLVIFFPPYQVAAYAAGPQSVKIPFSQLSSILKAKYK